jgi:predicted nucleic acid-binding protein
MIGIDTNVLVRHLVQDDLRQARAATQVITQRCTRDDPGFINRIVLCELVWVLESAYGYPKVTIVAVLEKCCEPASSRLRMHSQRGLPFACIRRERRTLRIACWEPPIG